MTEKELSIETNIDQLPGVGPSTAEKLEKLGVKTVLDLLELLPRRVEDHTNVLPLSGLKYNELCVIKGLVKRISTRRSRKGALIVQAEVEDESGKINALWFNQRYVIGMLPPGKEIILYGERKPIKSLGLPFFVKKILFKTGVQPIYPATAGLFQSKIINLLKQSEPVINKVDELLPSEVRNKINLISRPEAIRKAHFGRSIEDALGAQKLFAAEEFLILALAVEATKSTRHRQKIPPLKADNEFLKKFVATLPFTLTDGQRKAAWEIIQDMGKGFPINRLLYGEVGSGKTAVALVAASAVINSGQKVVMLAPTLALAHQQATVCQKMLEKVGLKVAAVTAARKDDFERADLIIGTHALLGSHINLENVGLVIVDEQHRFGVEQRQHLLDISPKAHLLMMTATPIPRSLAQTIFGHLEISYLLDKPVHQKEIETKIFSDLGRVDVEEDIEARLKRNEPGYVICPLIDEVEEDQADLFTLERKTIQGESKRLKTRFPEAKITVLHGRLKPKEKEQIIGDFREGKVDILLSTTVVEVGIDNPAATWILIEEADRLGLAQLHQLRGRVGRGEKQSVCYLSNSGLNPLGTQRLEALLESNNGLELAEKDLGLRGPGEMIGAEQSGLPPLRYASWSDTPTLRKMFGFAQDILSEGLDKYPALAKKVAELIESNDELARA